MAEETAAAGRAPWWPLAAAVVALVLPNGAVWAGVCVVAWAGLAVHARRRGAARAAELERETARLREHASDYANYLSALRTLADRGDADSLRVLLDRWHAARPPAIAGVDLRLENRASVGGRGDWWLLGQGIPRSAVPAGVPRAGRGGRRVLDKRPAAAMDEDLAELNAAAVLAAIHALFAGDTPQRVTVRLAVQADGGTGTPMPWVTLATSVSRHTLEAAMARGGAPSEMVRALGGDVGRCRAQRYTPAREPAAMSDRVPERVPERATTGHPAPRPPRRATPPSPVRRDAYAGRPVTFGDDPPTGGAARAGAIPPPPAGRTRPAETAAGDAAAPVPTPANVVGVFSVVARRFAEYPGDATARFVAFQHYWATYADMAPGQLKFYFKWRHAVRSGQTPRTDLSYVFVHVYELLHGVGASGAADAARQLERLWTAYRPTYPQLDGYLVAWTADLLATEVDAAAALAWVERTAALGVPMRGDELRVITDRHWAAGDYAGMPRVSLALLTGDPRIGDNKFFQQHDAGPDGPGWVERVYRDAMGVTDRVVAAAEGGTPRELVVRQRGLTRVTREAFQSAVYDWPRKPVVLGTVAALPDGAPAIRTYRNAVRYAENLLRAEKGFGAKLRGVEVSPALAAALDAHVAAYVAATRPKPRVTIDFERARALARESDDVRARLLVGLDGADVSDDAVGSSKRVPTAAADSVQRPRPPATPNSVPAPSSPPSPVGQPTDVPDGLLTDLAAVQAAVAALTTPARRLLEALEACGWEADAANADVTAAAQGALVSPLVDEINERTVDAVGDVLIVQEDARLVVQDDFRDEIYWVLKGTLDGFGAPPGARSGIPAGLPNAAATAVKGAMAPRLDADGFGPTELRVLTLLLGVPGGAASVAAYAADHATTPLLLFDRLNEAALASPYGDLVVDLTVAPPALFADAMPYVADLLARAHGGAPPSTPSLAP